jgi:hypothetical protein
MNEHVHVHQKPPEVVHMNVTRVTFYRGAGCCERSPVRAVTAYYDDMDNLIVELDMAMEDS